MSSGDTTIEREQIRLDALRRYDVLGAFGEAQFDDVAELAAHLCQTPMAGITAMDASRKWFIASHGLSVRETSRADAFCQHVIGGRQPQTLMVPDALADPRFARNELVTGEPAVRFYVGAPLVTAGGEVLGALCAMDRVPRTLTAQQLQALELLGRHVIMQLEARRNLHEADKVNRALLSIVEDEQLARSAARSSERQMREINERFQAVVQATNDAVRDWDITTNTLWWSEGAETQFGLGAAETAAGIDAWRSRIHADDRRRVSLALDRALRSQASSWASRYRFRRSDGVHVMVADRGRILRDREGNAMRLLAGMRDISELNELEEQLRQSQRLEAIGQLTGGVAHDFNNLLTVMLGNAEVLKEELGADPRHEMMADMIATAAQRAAELTQRLLAFARRQVLSPEAVDVNKLISGIKPLLSRAIPENIDIELMPGRNMPSALVDPAQLENALLNLVVNARDAMPRGGSLIISIEAVQLDAEYCADLPDVEPGSYIRVSVSDTGEGIPPENMARLFEPFFTTKEKGKGTGLGLPMVYGFVKQSGGHVSVSSKLGQGTVVRMDLPRTPEDDAPSVTLPALDLSVPHGSEDILLVEDDSMVRSYICEQLESLGYRVQLASDGLSALQVVKGSHPIDLLLTDIMMPGMSGQELAEAALHVRPGLKVLFCSGYSEDVALKPGGLDPGVELMTKPFRRGELARRVREVLDGQGAPPP